MVDAAVLKKMEDGYAKLMASDSKSLLKKHLSKEVFDKLKNVKTPTFGSTLLDCIQSGLENHDSGFGIYAPDAEAYSVFSEVFDPMIEDYHTGFKKADKHPNRDFGDVNAFGNLDPTGEYVVSTRVRCGRSMEGYPFNPCLTEAQYKEMETKVASTLSGLEGELKGKFYPLTGMDKAVQQQLTMIISYSKKVIVSYKQLMHAVIGQVDVVFIIMIIKLSWYGVMKKIIYVLFQCKWVVIWVKYIVV